MAPKKKAQTVGIGSVNEVARATSSYSSRRDHETSRMQARMDSQHDRFDSLEDLLDVMAVGNPIFRERWRPDEWLSGCNNGILNRPIESLQNQAPPPTNSRMCSHSFFYFFHLYCKVKYYFMTFI